MNVENRRSMINWFCTSYHWIKNKRKMINWFYIFCNCIIRTILWFLLLPGRLVCPCWAKMVIINIYIFLILSNTGGISEYSISFPWSRWEILNCCLSISSYTVTRWKSLAFPILYSTWPWTEKDHLFFCELLTTFQVSQHFRECCSHLQLCLLYLEKSWIIKENEPQRTLTRFMTYQVIISLLYCARFTFLCNFWKSI